MIFLSIIVFLFIFSILVVAHEFGHFYAAKKSRVKVEEFGLGMGKKIFGKKIGETEFTFNAIPFGGFVRMLGEEDKSNDPRSFGKAKLLNRMLITLGGVFMNFVLAIFLLTFLFTIGTDPILVSRDDITSAADKGWILFQAENGRRYTRDELIEMTDPIPVKVVYQYQEQKPFPSSFVFAIKETGRISWAIVKKTGEIPVELIEKHKFPEGVAGPIGIANVTHKVVPLGFLALVKLMALLSISLGVMNLLPIPALDGGRFFFQIIEFLCLPFKIKPNEKIENYAHSIGYAALMGLLILITWNDIYRIFFL